MHSLTGSNTPFSFATWYAAWLELIHWRPCSRARLLTNCVQGLGRRQPDLVSRHLGALQMFYNKKMKPFRHVMALNPLRANCLRSYCA